MKTHNPPGEDAPLDALLQEWKSKPSLPPRFQERVWRSIERAETAPAPSVSLGTLFVSWITHMLPKPALAKAYVMVLLLIGATAGWNQARQETARVTGELRARYAQVIDPYQAARQP